MIPDRYNPRRKHSTSYYSAVLRIIADGLLTGQTQLTIRETLTNLGLRSPTNGEWTEAALSGVLARIRNRSGYFYTSLLELVVQDEISHFQLQRILRSHS